MNIEDLRTYCLSKPATSEELPFGPDALVFKVAGKMFLLTNLSEFSSFNVKCEPEKAVELREQYPDVVLPGYHMNKRHWNTVIISGGLSDQMLREFIDDSYQNVVKTLPKKTREALQA